METKEKVQKLRDFGINSDDEGIIRLLSLPEVRGN